MTRLICWLLGHVPVRRFEVVDPTGADPDTRRLLLLACYGRSYDACGRCETRLSD
jgi:hypothetical protein